MFLLINNGDIFISRALLKAKATCIIIARVTINRKVNKQPYSISEETSETHFFMIINKKVIQDQFWI